MIDRLFFARHLEEDEHISVVFHKHWFLGVRALLWPTLSLLGSWYVLWILYARQVTTFWMIATGVWTAASTLWWLRSFFDYYLDAWIVTTHGVIDIAWHGWFHRESSRVLYSDINGVSYEIKGILGTLMRFGTVSIEKISTGTAISLENVSRPKRVESAILQNMEAYLHTKNLKDSTQVQELLATMVAEHIQKSSLPAQKL
jgi:hypothetical protein